MELSFPPTPQLNEALAKAKLEMDKIIQEKKVNFSLRNGTNLKFDYADLDTIHAAITPALSNNGLVLTSRIDKIEGDRVLATILSHVSGEMIHSIYPLPDKPGEDPKTFGAQLTYARRYNINCLLELHYAESSEELQEQKQKVIKEIKREAGVASAPKPTKKADSSFIDAVSGYNLVASQHQEPEPNGALYPQHEAIVRDLIRLSGLGDRIKGYLEKHNKSASQLSVHLLHDLISKCAVVYAGENGEAIAAIQGALIGRLALGISFSEAWEAWHSTYISKEIRY